MVKYKQNAKQLFKLYVNGDDKLSIYLNTNKLLENYKNLYRSKYFVDKSLLIEKLSEVIETSDKYICVTRPRRFGKSSVADIVRFFQMSLT